MKPIWAPAMVTHAFHHHFAAFLLMALALFLTPATLDAQAHKLPNASSETVLYNFTGGVDGATPYAGVVFDQAGNLYGTTTSGGTYGHGTVYKLTPSGGNSTETVLYSFTGGQDGDAPFAGVIFDRGNLWGTTYQGGDPGCHCGTVFELTPAGSSWTFNLIHTFFGGSDGAHPSAGLVSGGGDLFGTTSEGGVKTQNCPSGCGTIFSPSFDRVWNNFTAKDGILPQSSLLYDAEDACFLGTTVWGPGGTGWGTVFADCDQTLIRLHTFSLKGPSGYNPLAGVLVDNHGNVFGSTSRGWNNKGTIFEIVGAAGGGRKIKVLHQFLGADGNEPAGDLLFDAAGNIYGTTFAGGDNQHGVVFKLTVGAKQKWTETVLHRFAGSDGGSPATSLIFDDADNLYGTTSAGGAYGAGVVFKIQNVRVGPQATLSPTSLRFGKQAINTTSAAKTVTLSNTGDWPLAISSITTSGNFAVSSNTCGATLAVAAQCMVSVTFTPTVLGTLTGTLTFTDDAPNSPQTVRLTGKGVSPGK